MSIGLQRATEASWQRNSSLISLAAALVALAVSLVLIPCYFASNDDTFIQQILAGTISGEPTGIGALVDPTFGALFSLLFSVMPQVPWWTLLHLALLVASMTLFGSTSFGYLRRRGARISLVCQFAFLSVLFICLFCAFIGRLQFTTTSSIVASAGVFCLIMRAGEESGRRPQSLLVPCALIVLGYCIRLHSGLLALGFLGVYVLLEMFTRGIFGGLRFSPLLRATKMLWAPFIVVSAVIGALLGMKSLAYSTPEWTASNNASSLLTRFTDYPHVPYEGNEELYSSIGWDEDFYTLVNDWYYLDDRYATAELSQVCGGMGDSVNQLVSNPVATMAKRLSDVIKPVPATYLCVFGVLSLAAMALAGSKRNRVLVWGTLALAAMLLAYLLLQGRFLARAFYAVVIPYACVLAALLLKMATERLDASDMSRVDERKELPKDISLAILSLVCAILSAGLFAISTTASRVPAAILGVASIGTLVFRPWESRHESAEKRSVVSAASSSIGNHTIKVSAVKIPLLLLVATTIALVAYLLPASLHSYGRGSDTDGWYQWQGRNVREFYAICNDNPDKLYIHAGLAELNNMDPWLMEWPVNQTSWAAWCYYFPWFGQTLREAGFNGRPTVDDLFDQNVRFVSDSWTDLDLFLRYLRGLYGDGVELKEEATFGDDVTIWRVVNTAS